MCCAPASSTPSTTATTLVPSPSRCSSDEARRLNTRLQISCRTWDWRVDFYRLLRDCSMDREHFLVALFPLSRLVPQSVAGLAARRFAATADICQQPCTLFPAAMIFATATDIDTGSRALAP